MKLAHKFHNILSNQFKTVLTYISFQNQWSKATKKKTLHFNNNLQLKTEMKIKVKVKIEHSQRTKESLKKSRNPDRRSSLLICTCQSVPISRLLVQQVTLTTSSETTIPLCKSGSLVTKNQESKMFHKTNFKISTTLIFHRI